MTFSAEDADRELTVRERLIDGEIRIGLGQGLPGLVALFALLELA